MAGVAFFPTGSQVRTSEDVYQSQWRTNMRPHQSDSAGPDDFPFRPAYVESAPASTLLTNTFQIQFKLKEVFVYNITVTPPQSNRPTQHVPVGKKRATIHQYISSRTPETRKCLATNFTDTLVSTIKLSELYQKIAEDEDIPVAIPHGQQPAPYSCRFKFKRTISPNAIDAMSMDVIRSQYVQEREEILQVLNIIVAHHAKFESLVPSPTQLSLAMRRHHDVRAQHKDCKDLGMGVELVRGFTLSVRPSSAGLLLQILPQATAFLQATALTALIDHHCRNPLEDLSLERFLRGIRVRATYGNCTTIRSIAGLNWVKNHWESPAEHAFDNHGQTVTVRNYFQRTYAFQASPKYPVIRFRSSAFNDIFIPADALAIEPGQVYRKDFTPVQVKMIKDFAQKRPAANLKLIRDQACRALRLDEPMPAHFGQYQVELARNLLTVPACRLNRPRLRYDLRSASRQIKPKDRGWVPCIENNASKPFSVTNKCDSFQLGCLFILVRGSSDGWYDRNWYEAYNTFRATVEPAFSVPPLDHRGDFPGPQKTQFLSSPLAPNLSDLNAISEGMTELRGKLGTHKPAFIMVFSSTRTAAVYNRVHAAANEIGVLASFYSGSKFCATRGAPSTYCNIALKVNQKLGGCNQTLDPDGDLAPFFDGRTMYVGIDVIHPTGESGIDVSRGAIVATTGANIAQFPGELFNNPAGQEQVDDLDTLIAARLQLWYDRNKEGMKIPEKIIVFRDGVSEGQYARVAEHEVKKMQAGMRAFCAERKTRVPRMTFIICAKRHHARFYADTATAADLVNGDDGNLLPGVLVDRSLTEARPWDFHLTSHRALQGSARGAHYVVLHDDLFHRLPARARPAQLLPRLIFHLCHLFQRATTSVSLCSPAYYADLLCARGAAWRADERLVERLQGSAHAGNASSPTGLVCTHEVLKGRMHYI